jgi:hypothetical protein
MKQFLPLAILWAMCSANAFADGEININSPHSNTSAGWTFSSSTLTITASGTYTITGNATATTNRIVVTSGVTANITLNNVNINIAPSNDIHDCDLSETTGNSAFDIMPGATVNLWLANTKNLTSGCHRPGLNVPEDATLTIQGNGALDAIGFRFGAGIGTGMNAGNCGAITINSGTVTATGEYSAGIGGGREGGHCGVITISGGTVTATS